MNFAHTPPTPGRFKDVTLYVHATRHLFEEAWLKAGPTGLGIMEKNRFASDQLRLRRNCYGVADSTMPNLSTAPGMPGAIVFKKTLLLYLKQTKDVTLTLTLPLVGKHRKARRNLDTAAIDADALFAQEIDRMSQKFLDANPENLFVAYRFKQPPHVNAGTTRAKSSTAKARSKPKPKQHPQCPPSDDRVDFRKDGGFEISSASNFQQIQTPRPGAYENLLSIPFEEGPRSKPADRPVPGGATPKPGDRFETNGTVWQLFRIYETVDETGSNSIACAYFDVDAAESFGQDYEYFLNLPAEHQESNFQDLDLDHLEVAFHHEVLKWIQESDLPTPASYVDKSAGRRTSSRVIPVSVPPPVLPVKPKAKRAKRKAPEGPPPPPPPYHHPIEPLPYSKSAFLVIVQPTLPRPHPTPPDCTIFCPPHCHSSV